jgi:predicted ATPase
MYITRIAAKQFKCFSSVDVELPKLTLLTGANSSGKSSLLYALFLPFQSVGFPFYLSPNGKYVNMGDFIEMVHCNKKKEIIELDLAVQFAPKKTIEFLTRWMLDPHSSLPQLKSLRVSGKFVDVSVVRSSKGSGYILKLRTDISGYTKSEDFKTVKAISSFLESLQKLGPSKRRKGLPKGMEMSFELKDIRGRHFVGLEELIRQLKSMAVQPISTILAQLDFVEHDLNYIGSFRLEPERTYYQRSKADREIGRSGENYIEQVIEWERRKAPEFAALRDSLNKLGLLTGLRTRLMQGGRFEVSVKTERSGVWASLTDVGYGISQFLPIAVADLQLSKESTLAVAQPEIHLHPKVQAALGDYFVERIQKQKRRYVLETHSEYLLNRVRLLIVKGNIEPSEVGIYYFQCSGCEATVHRLAFTKSGKIEGAPQGFFDTYMMDVMDIALKAEQRV